MPFIEQKCKNEMEPKMENPTRSFRVMNRWHQIMPLVLMAN